MWYRYILLFVGAVTIFSVCLYVFEWVLSVKSHNDFLNGSLVGWVFGHLYMIIYTNYGIKWIKGAPIYKKNELHGITFPQGEKVGQVLSISPNLLNGKMLSDEKYYKWDGEEWIEFNPSDGGNIYTFHYKDIQP